VIERAASRPLGAVVTHDLILLGRQELAPLRIGWVTGYCFAVMLMRTPFAP
jgi:hypothetical protein